MHYPKLSKYFFIAFSGLLILVLMSVISQSFPAAYQSTSSLSNSYYVKYNPENKNPVAEDAVSQIIYVNYQNSKASDSNPGNDKFPLKTLSKATEIVKINYKNNIGTKIIIYPGIYRESINLDLGESSKLNAPIVFEAKESGSVIISGSDVWSGWKQEHNSNIYTQKWLYDWVVPDNPWPTKVVDVAPIVRRKEMVFINGTLLRQRLSLSELTEGTFYVSSEKNIIYIYPKVGTKLEKSTIEVATRPTLLFSKKVNNLVIRGLTFQHATSYFREAAVSIRSASKILVEDSQFLWNNWHGLHIRNGENITVRKVTANYNGQRGVGGSKLKNILYEDVESSYNNWRGDWGGFYEWDAGNKFFYLRNATFRRYRAVGNMAAGLWLDFDNVGVWIDDAYICNNFQAGLYIEASHHILVTNSSICNNIANTKTPFTHPGLFGSTSSHVTLEKNIICGNEVSQIKIYVGKEREVTNWETQEKYLLISDNWTIKNNIIMGVNANQLLTYLQPNGKGFADTLVSDGNIWYNPEKNRVFQIQEKGRVKGFRGWQFLTNQDRRSVFARPRYGFSCGLDDNTPTITH